MTMQFGKLHTLSLSGLVVCQELLAVSLDSGQLNTSCHLINSTQFPWSFLKGSSTTLFPVVQRTPFVSSHSLQKEYVLKTPDI